MRLVSVFFFIILVCASQCYENRLIEVIKEFLDFKQPLLKVFAFVCWNNSYKIRLMKALKNHHVSFQKVHDTLPSYQKTNYHMFLLDEKCANYKRILEEANSLELFRSPFRWLIIGNKNNFPQYLDVFVDSKLYFIEEELQSYTIKSIYKITKYDQHFFENDIATWDGIFMYYNELSMGKNRSNLNGLAINCSIALISEKFNLTRIWDNRNTHIDTEHKVNFRMWNHALFALDAVGNCTVATTWGYLNKTTGLYSGMIGDLQTHRADIGGGVAFITPDRLDVVDYISPASASTTTFVYRAPALSLVANVFILPFEHSVWLASFALAVTICMTIYVITKWEYKDVEFMKTLEPKPSVLLWDFAEVSILTFGGICQQGSEAEPRSTSGRVAMLISFTALMFLYTAYSANIVAMLQSTSESVSSIEGFLNSKIELGVENTSYSDYYFQNITEATRKAIYDKKIAPDGKIKNYLDLETGIRRVREEFFAFHTEPGKAYRIIAQTFQENEKCSLRELRVWTVSAPWLPIAKKSSFKELIKIGIRKVHETGVYNREYKKLYMKKPMCQGAGSTFTNVGFIESYYAFYIFGIGCSVAIMLLGVEYIIAKKWQKMNLLNYTKR